VDASDRREKANESVNGARVSAFLADPVVAGALAALEREYFESWKRATSVMEREDLHAKIRVLNDFQSSLDAIVNNGDRARIELDAERAQSARRH
jgi:hypothetical protein